MSKKIGPKLAESVRQKRNPPADGARPEATRDRPSPPAQDRAVTAKQPLTTAAPMAPSSSHGVLHPSRIWPD